MLTLYLCGAIHDGNHVGRQNALAYKTHYIRSNMWVVNKASIVIYMWLEHQNQLDHGYS
jgi:hypothetical protein